MTRKYMPLLRESTHAALMAENLAVPMRGRNAPFPDEASEICYLALGEPVAKIETSALPFELYSVRSVEERNTSTWPSPLTLAVPVAGG